MNTLQSQDAATPPLEESNTRLIPLTRGKFAIVDANDFHWLNQWKWGANSRKEPFGLRWYAVREFKEEGKGVRVYMHRVIMGAPKGKDVDHRDGDGLNNTRSNLRLATRQQNIQNGRLRSNNTSGYKGVWRCSYGNNRWVAGITINGRNTHIGIFATKELAARAYDAAAVDIFGEFARLNFPKISLDTNTSI